jgi:hypothetical protein
MSPEEEAHIVEALREARAAGGSFQVRYREPGSGDIVTRSFRRLEDAVDYKPALRPDPATPDTYRVEVDALAEIDALTDVAAIP